MDDISTNKMGTQPIPKVLLNMGVPIVLSMVLQACYNIVDSMFVANMPDTNGLVHTGELAVNALTLAFPIQMLIVAFSIGTGVGVNALLARYLGQGKSEQVARTAGNGILLGIIIYIVFFIFGSTGIDAYLKTQSNDPHILAIGHTYLTICTLFSFGNILYGIYEKILQATGKTVYSTAAQVTGALTNIVLDPILIFGWFHLPAMGVAGAAWATVMGQVVSLIIAMLFQYRKNKEVKSGWKYLHWNGRIIAGIYKIGVPAIIMQALMSFMTYGANIIFAQVSTAAVTAYGIFYKIQQFILFAAFGIRDAITPLVSFNKGMNSKERIQQSIKYGILYTSILMIAGTLVVEFFGAPLANVFQLSHETEILCIRAMHIVGLSFICIGISVSLQGVFQGLDSGIESLIISLLRLLIIPLPIAYAFSKMANAEYTIWWAFPIAEVIACAVAIFFAQRKVKQL